MEDFIVYGLNFIFDLDIVFDFDTAEDLDVIEEPHVFLHKLAISGSEQSSFIFGQTVGSVEMVEYK